MRRTWSLSAKLGAIGSALLLVAIASIGLTLWVTWQLEGGAAAVNEAGRMRMQTWRLAQMLPGAEQGQTTELNAQFEQSVSVLRAGDPARPLFVPGDARTQLAFVEVQRAWEQLRRDWAVVPPPAPQAIAAQAQAFVARIDVFVSAIEQQLSLLTSILNAVQFTMVALALGSAVTLLYSAYLFVFNPLTRLQAGLARIEAGDLAVRVEPGSNDEFGALSAGFNRMASTLQGLYQNLEQRVQIGRAHV